MKRCLFLFGLFFFINGYAQKPLQVTYNEQLPSVKTHVKSSYKKISTATKDMSSLVRRLQKNGYIAANLDTIFKKNDSLFAEVFVGQKILIDTVIVNGLDSAEYFHKKLKNEHLKITTIEDLLHFQMNISNYYENNGYPFVSTQISDLQLKDSVYTAIIEIEKGNFITLDSIIIAGNARLRPSFLYGYLGLRKKRPYNESILTNVNNRLSELSYITQTQNAALSFSPHQANLFIYANKVKTNQFDGFLGIVPNNETTGKLLLTGQLNLNLTNVFAIGENLKFSWNRVQVQSQTLDISVDFPFLFYSSFGFDAAFGLDKKDTSYLNLSTTIALRYYIQQSNYLRFYYTYKSSRLIANESLTNLTQLPQNIDYNTNHYGLAFVWQKLDYIFNPRKGFYLMADVAVGRKKILKNSKIDEALYTQTAMKYNNFNLHLLADFYFPIRKQFTWVLSLQFAHIQSSKLYNNELYKLGGLATLRGFDEQSILASTYVIARNELRFLFTQKSYLQIFFDIAGYQKKLETYVSDFPFGFGAGLSFDTKVGIFAFNYALGKQLNNPIKLSAGKITFGYTALF